MARHSTRRQKQLERKRAKRKEKRQALARRQPQSLADRMARASSGLLLHCCFSDDPADSEGMVQVLVSREFEAGLVAVSIFLVDTWCLGVKDAFADIRLKSDYQDNVYTPLTERYNLRRVSPECARKFVEGAVEYARRLGFEPHAGYRKAAPIFGNADPADCPVVFEYGHNGKPHFVSGPGDEPAKCVRVMNTLQKRLGEGQFDVTMVNPTDPLMRWLGVEDEEGDFGPDDEWLNDEEYDEEPYPDDEDESRT